MKIARTRQRKKKKKRGTRGVETRKSKGLLHESDARSVITFFFFFASSSKKQKNKKPCPAATLPLSRPSTARDSSRTPGFRGSTARCASPIRWKPSARLATRSSCCRCCRRRCPPPLPLPLVLSLSLLLALGPSEGEKQRLVGPRRSLAARAECRFVSWPFFFFPFFVRRLFFSSCYGLDLSLSTSRPLGLEKKSVSSFSGQGQGLVPDHGRVHRACDRGRWDEVRREKMEEVRERAREIEDTQNLKTHARARALPFVFLSHLLFHSAINRISRGRHELYERHLLLFLLVKTDGP